MPVGRCGVRRRGADAGSCSGSHIENWHSILRNGLVNASYTKLQVLLADAGSGSGQVGRDVGSPRDAVAVPHAQAAVGAALLTPVFSCKLHGAAYGKGIYLSPISSISFGYSGKRLPAPLVPPVLPSRSLHGTEELHGIGMLKHPSRIPCPSPTPSSPQQIGAF